MDNNEPGPFAILITLLVAAAIVVAIGWFVVTSVIETERGRKYDTCHSLGVASSDCK